MCITLYAVGEYVYKNSQIPNKQYPKEKRTRWLERVTCTIKSPCILFIDPIRFDPEYLVAMLVVVVEWEKAENRV
jgi:hypothetical protein